MFSHIIIDYLFVFSVIVIWFMLAYQFILFLLGYLYGTRAARLRRKLEKAPLELPAVSLMVPAHNEGIVISYTLEALTKLEYPRDRLEILVINDGSTDDTACRVESVAARDPRVRLFTVPAEFAARGKSAALNRGLKQCSHDIIGIFDADNLPEPDSVLHLARQLVADPDLGAVIGKFRCINKRKNLLTRFINLESLAFQWIIQAGRWRLLRMSTLPGTNYLIRRSLLEALGGWDEQALTEDAEMSIRIYQAGYLIKFIPYAVTWEQEPETLRVWFKQRVRWARGNNYVLEKYFTQVFKIKPRAVGLELFYAMGVYYVFFTAILLSDLLFIVALVGLISIPVPGPYSEVWLFAYLLFILELVIALTREKEDSPLNILLIALSYFTYCQLWIAVVLKGVYDDFILKREHVWVKTQRFRVSTAEKD
ncbi:MAG TPA: glycosyltransferase family 2 protein [Acidobacteriota bacterium]|nr:glycosyltransferase family 2 protein [Acidobacteriota bacterium]